MRSLCRRSRWLLGRDVAAAAVTRAGPAEPQAVTFTARDGVEVAGSLFLPEKQPAPAVVLLHMMPRSQHDWDATGARLAAAGIAALAIDFRRNGGPARGAGAARRPILGPRARRRGRARVPGRPPRGRPARIGMAGASLGANVAAMAAGNDAVDPVAGPALASTRLSRAQDGAGARKFGSRPALLVASSEDPYALRTARQAVTMGDGPRELRVLSGAGHGTVMLARHPDLIDCAGGLVRAHVAMIDEAP